MVWGHLDDFGDLGEGNPRAGIGFFDGALAGRFEVTVGLRGLGQEEAADPADRLTFGGHLAAAGLGAHTGAP